MDKVKLDVADLLSIYDVSMPYHLERFSRLNENLRLRSYDHLSKEEKAAYESQGRQNITIPLIASKLNYFIAYQRAYRTEWRVSPKQDPSDEIKASIYGIQLQDLESRCDMKYVESDVFDAGIGTDCGVFEIYLQRDREGNEIPAVKNLDPRDFIFDHNAIEYDKSDGMFMAKMHRTYRYLLREDYPKSKVDRLGESYYRQWGNDRDDLFTKLSTVNPEYDLLTVFTHYHKVGRSYYHAYFNDVLNLNGKINEPYLGKYPTKAEAEKAIREQQTNYILALKADEIDDGEVVERWGTYIDRYVFTAEEILEYEKTDMCDFPFVPFFSFSHLNNYWTLTDMLKTTQQQFDRLMAQIDYGLSTDLKGGYEVNVDKLHDGITPVEAMRMLQENGVVPVVENGAVSPINRQGISWQWVNVAQIMQSHVEDLAGGRAMQGLSSGANETGVAVEAKRSQGELYNSVFLDNLRRTKQILAKRLIWWFNKYDTSGRVVKVAGDSLPPQFIMPFINNGLLEQSITDKTMAYFRIKPDLNHLKDSEFDIEISNRRYTENEQDRKLNQLIAVTQVNPMIGQTLTFTREMLQSVDLDFKTRMQISQELEQLMYNQMVMQQSNQMYAMNNQLQSGQLQAMQAQKELSGNNQQKKQR